MASDRLTTELDDHGVLVLTLNRPEKLNALTPRLIDELIRVFDESDTNDEVRAVVVTGAGRAFCAGIDLSRGDSTFGAPGSSVNGDREPRGVPPEHSGPLALRIYESLKPVVGAINGAAVGVGATMTLPMDVRIASEHARFGFVFTQRGIVPDACSSWFLPRVVGISRALEWSLTGTIFGADEALAGGLVRDVVPADDLLPTAVALARRMADGSAPVSAALTRRFLWRMLGAEHPMEAHRLESVGLEARGTSPDAAEGVSAFLNKRSPSFPMRVSADMPPWFAGWDERPPYEAT